MDFSQRRGNPRRHLIGITFVVLLHAALIYAILTGLAKKMVDVVRAPIETKVIEEIKKPPPPPEIIVPPPPRLEAPPPPFIPPPEVQIATPPPPLPTITATTPTPPPAPVVIAPAPPPVVAAAPAPAPAPALAPVPSEKPAPTNVGVACPGYREVMLEAGFPGVATRRKIASGEVVVAFTVAANGDIKDASIKSSTHLVFDAPSLDTVKKFKCLGVGRDVTVTVPFGYVPPRD